MDFSVTLALILGSVGLLLLFIYKYLTRDFGYWETQGVPFVKPYPIIGSSLQFFSKPPSEIEDERFKKYGRIYGSFEINKITLNIGEPELVRQVLVKDFHIFTNRRSMKFNVPELDSTLLAAPDETWKRIRSVVSPSFTSGKMRKMNCHFVEAADGLINNFLVATDSNETVNVKKFFSSYSLDLIGLCAFGIRVESLKNPNHPFVLNSRKAFGNDIGTALFLFIPGFARLFSRFILKRMGFLYFIGRSEEIIKKRREGKQTPQIDFVQLLLDAHDDDDDGKEDAEIENKDSERDEKTHVGWNIIKSLSDTEIHSQTTLFLIVGHDTASTALSFMAYELAMNPDIQDKLFQEVTDAYNTHGEFNYDVVAKMTYLNAVVNETLRLHTVAMRAEREAKEDYVLGSTGITIPKGGLAMILIHAIHHDPEFYPEPEKFKPERFLPENRDSLTPHAFLPFADGPRNCVAMRFVFLEIKLCMAMLLKRIKFVATDETKKPIEYFKSPGILLPKEIKMAVEKRT